MLNRRYNLQSEVYEEMIRKLLSNVLLLSKTFILMVGVFFAAMVAVSFIPNSWVDNNVQSSVQVMEEEGIYRKLNLADKNATQLDNFTDRIMVRKALETSENPLERAMVPSYARYWQGYLTFLKPLLVFVSIGSIRFIYSAVLLALIFMVFNQLNVRFGMKVATLFGIILIGIRYYVLPLSMQFSDVFIILFGAVLVLLKYLDMAQSSKFRIVYFLIVGGVTNFVDFLTVPLITYLIPLSLYLYASIDTNKETMNRLKNFVMVSTSAGVAWFIGYAGTWVSKWLISSLVLKKNVVSDAVTQILFRTEGDATYPVNHLFTIVTNLKLMFSKNYILLLLVLGIVFVSYQMMLKHWRTSRIKWELVIISCIPFIWYLVLANHSQIHAWFTYRLLAGFIFAVGLAVISGTDYKESEIMIGNR